METQPQLKQSEVLLAQKELRLKSIQLAHEALVAKVSAKYDQRIRKAIAQENRNR